MTRKAYCEGRTLTIQLSCTNKFMCTNNFMVNPSSQRQALQGVREARVSTAQRGASVPSARYLFRHSLRRSHLVPRHSARIDAAQFVQTPLFETFKWQPGSWVAVCAAKLAGLDATWRRRSHTPQWLSRETDWIAQECLSRIQDRSVIVSAQAVIVSAQVHCGPCVNVVLSVTKYHGKYLRCNVYDDVMRLCRVGMMRTEHDFHGTFVMETSGRPRCFPRPGDVMSVLCNGTETAAMVLSDDGRSDSVHFGRHSKNSSHES